jgi:two-component system sensor histidine kinase PhcS
VFVNLIQNSLDAMKHKNFNGEQPAIRIEGRDENGQVRLSVRDNGEGMAPATINKVFDPFFTTKDVGEGMGLGLTICYRIVQESHGRISVESELGKHSQFTLEFPSVEKPAALAAAPVKEPYEQPA